jgi:DNA helicase-2/ATP-dependent DNA helicase PcrA
MLDRASQPPAAGKPPILIDELSQYFRVYRAGRWENFCKTAGFGDNAVREINTLFWEHQHQDSRHYAATHALTFFNRLSEECLQPKQLESKIGNSTFAALIRMYEAYVESLRPPGQPASIDFALLQQAAFDVLNDYDGACNVFQHVIVDEYQDTNTIQEQLFFGWRKVAGICLLATTIRRSTASEVQRWRILCSFPSAAALSLVSNRL